MGALIDEAGEEMNGDDTTKKDPYLLWGLWGDDGKSTTYR